MKILAALCAAVMVAAPGTALAHRGHASLSVVKIDAETGAVSVEHRMAAHDVEPALTVITPDAQPNLDDPKALSGLVAYIGDMFGMATASGEKVVLQYVGSDLAGDGIVLRYKGTLPQPDDAFWIESDLLEETYADQENQVNIHFAGVTKTLLFRTGDAAQEVSFD